MNTNSKEFKVIVRAYLMACIPDVQTIANDYGVTVENTDKARVNWVADTFEREYGYTVKRIGKQSAFSEWLQGLPSTINVDFENYRIIELAKEWGSLQVNATEKQEYKILSNWFNFISFKFWQLHTSLNK